METCPICEEKYHVGPRHVCPPEWTVELPDDPGTRRVIRGWGVRNVVEAWARWYDRAYTGMYPLANDEETATVHVTSPKGEHLRLSVSGELVTRYTARMLG
jgi:hypothetical protein